MTLSAYLGLLSLGSTIQARSSLDSQQEEQDEINAIRRLSNSISRAERDIVSTVSLSRVPVDRRGIVTFIVIDEKQ
jgi:hypothetical protein